jgi:hypothetical protein
VSNTLLDFKFNLIEQGRQIWKKTKVRHYHTKANREAERLLWSLTRTCGPLPKKIRNSCDSYAIEVLGNSCYSPWLYVYSVASGGFREGWIPDNFYGACVVPRIKAGYRALGGLRALSPQLLGLSHPFQRVSFINGLFLDSDFRVFNKNQAASKIFQRSNKVVFKLDDTARGNGVFIFSEKNFEIEEIARLGNGLFQDFVEQEETLKKFSGGAVATLRLTSVIDDDGAVSVRAAHLRLGVQSEILVRPKTQVRVPIDRETGEFYSEGYLSTWERIRTHPTNGERFSGNRVRSYSECRDLVKKAHLKVPFVRCVGWDLAITAEGEAILLEWNTGHNGIAFSEAVQGPCFVGMEWEKFRG